MDWELIALTILGSSVVATVVTKLFDLSAEKRHEEEDRYQELYAPIKFHLMMMDSLDKNKTDLMEEKKQENGSEDYKREINSLIGKWWDRAGMIQTTIEINSGYIKKEHFKLMADFIDGMIKRDIIGTVVNKGTSLSSKERMSKVIDAVEALKKELLK